MMEYRDGLDILLGYWHLCLTLLVPINKGKCDSLLLDLGG